MCNYSFFVGADISKSVIDVSYYDSGKSVYLGQFSNNQKGFTRVVNKLSKISKHEIGNWFVCFENTGVYSKPFLAFLFNQSIPCKEESALKISRSLGLRRGKDDKVDSMDICQYAYEKRDSLIASKLPSSLILRLRKLLARRDFLVRQRQSLKVSLKEQKGFIDDELYDELNIGNTILIETYDLQIKGLEVSIKVLINSDPKVASNDDLARSVIGIGNITSAYMIAVTENYTTFDDPRKFACYCGVAPFPNRSGTRKGSTRVSHIANKKMKSLFSNCTMSAINFDPEIAKYYKRKKEEGKKAGVVLNAVKNKLIQRVFSVIKRQTPYVKLMSYA
jgi:transposase